MRGERLLLCRRQRMQDRSVFSKKSHQILITGLRIQSCTLTPLFGSCSAININPLFEKKSQQSCWVFPQVHETPEATASLRDEALGPGVGLPDPAHPQGALSWPRSVRELANRRSRNGPPSRARFPPRAGLSLHQRRKQFAKNELVSPHVPQWVTGQSSEEQEDPLGASNPLVLLRLDLPSWKDARGRRLSLSGGRTWPSQEHKGWSFWTPLLKGWLCPCHACRGGGSARPHDCLGLLWHSWLRRQLLESSTDQDPVLGVTPSQPLEWTCALQAGTGYTSFSP